MFHHLSTSIKFFKKYLNLKTIEIITKLIYFSFVLDIRFMQIFN